MISDNIDRFREDNRARFVCHGCHRTYPIQMEQQSLCPECYQLVLDNDYDDNCEEE